MARDEGLEEILRQDLASRQGLSEKTMFGGLAWLLGGNLVCAARDDGMLIRLGRGNDERALTLTDIVPMTSRGRRMSGWVQAGPAAYGDDGVRRRLLADALAFVEALPPK